MLLLLKLLLVSFISLADEAASPIIIMGDSISEGYGVPVDKAYPALLEKKIEKENKRKIKVISSSISGSTTASGPGRVNWILKSKPSMVIVALGGNDGLRGIRPEETKKNLETTILALKKSNTKIVLAGMKMPPNYGVNFTQAFEKIFPELVKKYQLISIPFLLKDVGGIKKMNQEDGIHPNEAGHEAIALTVYQSIKDHL